MFNKTIFKQTFKANIRLWCIITVILVAMSSLIIGIFNPGVMEMMAGMMERIIDDPRLRQQILAGFSLLNVLGTQFYGGMGIILVLIYLIITANSLIANQVDRGSMAYILSTPIKRTTVVVTKAVYFVTALFVMFALLTASGILTAQFVHGGILTRAFTTDVREVADMLGKSRAEVADNLHFILANPEAVEHGANARRIDTDVYMLYLQMLIAQQQEQGAPAVEQTPGEQAHQELMQDMFSTGLEAAAEVLQMSVTALSFSMGLIKDNPEALAAAVEASGMPEPQFIHIINMRLANEQIMRDNRVNFDIYYYSMLNLGLFLLMFATSAISFLASCFFNLSKNAVALGAGIPIAFYLFQTMAQVGDELEFFRYLTINTFYNPIRVVNYGNFMWHFCLLAVIGVVLYLVSVKVFKEKDLPL
ncbi:MAG: ABC-2 transporter permease [Firmicutes bacterium]|nr:ABC-2 transporter permease [Bacillota bacterium]